MKKITVGIIASFILTGVQIKGQDIHFSQWQQTPLLVNPANAGNFDGYFRGLLIYRNQWFTAGAPFQTYSASVDGNVGLKKNKAASLGLGAFLYGDQAGAAKWATYKGDFSANAMIQASKKVKLAGAVSAGVGQNTAKFDNLTWGNQYNGKEFNKDLPSYEVFTNPSFTWFDVGSGVNFEYDQTSEDFERNAYYKFKAGFAVFHLNQPRMKFSSLSKEILDRKYIFNTSLAYDIKNTPVTFTPLFVYMKQGKAREAFFGSDVRYRFKDETKITGARTENALHAGLYYRYGDAMVLNLAFEFKGMWIGFAYDHTLSSWRFSNRGFGAVELSIRWINMRDGLFKQRREFGKSGKPSPGSTPK